MNDTSALSDARATASSTTVTPLVRDALARLVAIREAIEIGDYGLAEAIAADLEDDLASALARLEDWPCAA